MPLITSSSNPKIKDAVSLRESKNRKETGLTIVEGYLEVKRALACAFQFTEIFYCPALLKKYDDGKVLEQLQGQKARLFEVPESVFEKMAYGERQEGIIAVCKPKAYHLSDLNKMKRAHLMMVLESVEKPGNLGAVLRTCDAVGVDGVIVCDKKTDIFNPNVIRASLGTVFSIKTVACSNDEALEFFKANKIQICAAFPDGKQIYSDTDLTSSTAMVMGTEHAGLSEFWMRHADLRVKIPMNGLADSLNVSVSAAVLLYEALRQRSGHSKNHQPKTINQQ
ncbi:MAG: RNA methyltransferase [Candidatus Omnitrophica bacterium]|nr:RNA methyltransferase [Candidatus Omnitrophota bacterium]